jgi:hypothetical protein
MCLAQAPESGSSGSEHFHDWLEPPDTLGGVFATFPEVKNWCRNHLWIPSDGRVPLVFDIVHIDKSRDPDISTAGTIYAGLQDLSNELAKNGGRLLIVDNDCCFNSRLFGNLEGRWPAKMSTECLPSREIQLKVPLIDSRRKYARRQWRRFM